MRVFILFYRIFIPVRKHKFGTERQGYQKIRLKTPIMNSGPCVGILRRLRIIVPDSRMNEYENITRDICHESNVITLKTQLVTKAPIDEMVKFTLINVLLYFLGGLPPRRFFGFF